MLPITDPTAIADQFAAATRDAHAHLTALSAELAATITPGPTPEWLTGHLSALHEAFSRGTVRACPHLTGGPGVAYAAVWAPGLMACPACAATLLRPVPAEDAICDRCRRPTSHIHPGVLATGPRPARLRRLPRLPNRAPVEPPTGHPPHPTTAPPRPPRRPPAPTPLARRR